MGLDVIHSLAKTFSSIVSGFKGIDIVLAYIGIGILALITIYYLIIGLAKGIRAVLNMEIKKFVLALALTGVAMIAIAVVIP